MSLLSISGRPTAAAIFTQGITSGRAATASSIHAYPSVKINGKTPAALLLAANQNSSQDGYVAGFISGMCAVLREKLCDIQTCQGGIANSAIKRVKLIGAIKKTLIPIIGRGEKPVPSALQDNVRAKVGRELASYLIMQVSNPAVLSGVIEVIAACNLRKACTGALQSSLSERNCTQDVAMQIIAKRLAQSPETPIVLAKALRSYAELLVGVTCDARGGHERVSPLMLSAAKVLNDVGCESQDSMVATILFDASRRLGCNDGRALHDTVVERVSNRNLALLTGPRIARRVFHTGGNASKKQALGRR